MSLKSDDPIDNQRAKWPRLGGVGYHMSPGMAIGYRCPYCNTNRPLKGRKRILIPGSKKVLNYKCAACVKEEAQSAGPV